MKPRSVSTFRNSDFGAFIASLSWSWVVNVGTLYQLRGGISRGFDARGALQRRLIAIGLAILRDST